jgi:Sulfotransferase family
MFPRCDGGSPTVAPVFEAHVQSHTVVLPQQRVLFLPMPKAACTSILWTLAGLAGLGPEDFENSTLPEPSAALTVHDMNAWAPEHRLSEHPAAILEEDGWLRFTVVRDPWRRLWSAWLSKLLLREPRFVAEYGEQPWFPRMPGDPDAMIEDFRRFVQAVGAGEAQDVHWSVQHDLSSQLPLTHVGRTEQLPETLALLHRHVGTTPPPAGRRNAGPLGLPPHAYDDETTAIVRRHYAADFEAFGYPDAPPETGTAAAWERRARAVVPLLAGTIDTHVRLGQLHRLAQRRADRMQSAETRLEARSARGTAPVGANVEGEADFNVRWGWAEGPPRAGMTAIVRVKNEARALPWTLPPLLRAVDRVVLVDNGSTDGTATVACEVAEATAAAPLDVARYPFAVARCGAEHVATAETSVHSLAYFYNWSFAHVRTSYALKWDGDMVLSDHAVAALRDLAWQLEAAELIVRVPRLGLYVADERLAYVDTALRNCEPWAWPNRPGYRFVKALEWELPMFPPGHEAVTLPEFSSVELKFLDGDEFGHWSPTDFGASPRTARKRREQTVFAALAAGDPPPDGVVAVHAPDGTHVIDYVREVWLPQAARAGAAPQPGEPAGEPRLHAGHAG